MAFWYIILGEVAILVALRLLSLRVSADWVLYASLAAAGTIPYTFGLFWTSGLVSWGAERRAKISCVLLFARGLVRLFGDAQRGSLDGSTVALELLLPLAMVFVPFYLGRLTWHLILRGVV